MLTKTIIFFLIISFASFKFQPSEPDNFVKLTNGEIEIFIDNVGNIILDPLSYSIDQTIYDNLNIYNAGFYISGKENKKLKFSNNFKLIRTRNHFQPGSAFTDPAKQSMFSITNGEKPFSESWINWKLAVEIGAEYYDGNLNGIYDPIDNNKNSLWDENEDRPPNLGEVYLWQVFNDGLPSEFRMFHNTYSMGIKIQQTTFLHKRLVSSNLDRILYIRYRIINKGLTSETLDSCYFTIYTDFDCGINIGGDLMGSDSLRNMGYTYQVRSTSNTTMAFTKFLSLPYSFYHENLNPNSIISVNNGILGIDTINGIYSRLSSISTPSYYSNPTMVPPTMIGLRNMQILGKYGNHFYLDPCENPQGFVDTNYCDTIDPKFHFSGNPVTKQGWVNNRPSDQRVYVSSGPFQLEKDKPIDIWVCYSSVKGESLEDAYNKMLEIDNYAQTFYNYNFFIEPPTLAINNVDLNDYDFYLWNNYPNPFNSSTKIRYNLD